MYKVSVVTVTFNCQSILEKTILSVVNQTYSNIEYIIIDGKSTDETMSVVERYKSKIDFVSSEPDKGIFDAMNKGIDAATGDWIIFMNAGDVFADNDVLTHLFAKSEYDDVSVIWGRTGVIRNNGIEHKKRSIPFYENPKVFRSMGFCHQAVFVSMSAIKNIRFDLSYRIAADYNMINTIYNNGGKFHYADVEIAIVEGRDGLSYNNRREQRCEEARICGADKTLEFFIYNNYRSFIECGKLLIGRK